MRLRRLGLAAALLAPPLGIAALAIAVYSYVHLSVPPRLGSEERAAAATLARTIASGQSPPAASAVALGRRARGPAVLTLWHRGRRLGRASGNGASHGDAIARAATDLAAQPKVQRLLSENTGGGQLQIDLVVAVGPFVRVHSLTETFGLHPGLEGIGVTISEHGEALLLPSELVEKNLLSAERPIDFIPDLNLGFDFERADRLLAKQAALPAGQYGTARRRYWRFRVDSFVERPDGDSRAPVQLTRGVPPGPALTPYNLREAALQGGRYLVAHLAENGRYQYQTNLSTGQSSNPMARGPYSLPRHAGTTYFLAELYRISGEAFLREPVVRAIHHLGDLIDEGGCRGMASDGSSFACVVDRGQHRAELGSTALAVVALVEFERATGEKSFSSLATELTEWILHMQRGDGSFAHVYDVRTGKIDDKAQLLYYSGEAALALARMYQVTGNERYRAATEKALDSLVGWYDFFLGGFFYGEEHWTCIAAEAAWPGIRKKAYDDFCRGYGEFLRRQQIRPGDFPDLDNLAGTYTFTPFASPPNTPAGSRTEAMVSAYLLSGHHGDPDRKIRRQIADAARFALRQQISEEGLFRIPERALALGGVPESPVRAQVRIDYVQHLCSGMIRAAEVLQGRGQDPHGHP